MEYSNPENRDKQVYCSPSKAGTPDILTQSLAGVFGKTTAVVAPLPAQSHEGLYTVPIQRYPHFNVAPFQDASSVETGTASSSDNSVISSVVNRPVSRISKDIKDTHSDKSSSGDLISEAWSLSCDMTRAWQGASQGTTSKPTEEVQDSVTITQDSAQELPVNDSDPPQEPPVPISVKSIEIPVQDCVMVDIPAKNTASDAVVQDERDCVSQIDHKPQHGDCANSDQPSQQSDNVPDEQPQVDNMAVTKLQDSVLNKENQAQERSAHIATDNRAGEDQIQQHPTNAAQSPEKIKQVVDKKSENSHTNQSQSPLEAGTSESKRQRIKSSDSSNSTTPARSSDCSERPQRKRKLPQIFCDNSVIKDSRETSFILKEHSKSQSASKTTPESKNTADEAEAERLKQEKLKQFQRLYVMSQRGYVPEKPIVKTENVEESPSNSPPESPESSPPRRTFSLMDIGISLNVKGEVTLSMPDDIKKLAKSGGSVNINFDVDCLDEDNCLKFKVTEDKEAITTALGPCENQEVPLIESEASSEHERSESPKIKTENEAEDVSQRTESSKVTEVISTRTDVKPSRDSSVQVDLNVINSEEEYLNEKLMRASTATGFVSYPRFTQVSGSSLATVHKVLKTVKKGLSIDKLTKKPTWFCSLCNLTGDYGDMGPLFGPFDIYVPPKSSYRNKNMSEGAKNLFEKLSSTFKKELTFNEENDITVEREEVWLHEDCICWSPGVYMIGFDIYGLEEIFKVARFTVCSECGEIGASLGCFKEGCSNRYHYRCSIEAKCKLIKTTFTVLCPTHSHGVVDNCLAVKPLMKVRNYLSQEEIKESEELLSKRPGDDAREFAVKITKTRIIRSRKNKKTKDKNKRMAVEKTEDHENQVSHRKRGRPRKIYPREELRNEEETENQEDDGGKGDEVEGEDERTTYECFGCSTPFVSILAIRRHLKAFPSCRAPHIAWCIENDSDLPPNTDVCFSCGHYVQSGNIIYHLHNVPQRRCLEEHIRVIRDVKGLDVKEYFAGNQIKRRTKNVPAPRSVINYKCFGCSLQYTTRRHLRGHLNKNQDCRRMNLASLIADKSLVPSDCKACFGCGNLLFGPMKYHFSSKPSCRKAHERVTGERLARICADDQDPGMREVPVDSKVIYGNDDNEEQCNRICIQSDDDLRESEEEEIEEEEREDKNAALLRLYCLHENKRYAKVYSMNRHLRDVADCAEVHIENFLKSGHRLPEAYTLCTNCGCYVRDEKRNIHFARSVKGCNVTHLTAGGGGVQRKEVKDEGVEVQETQRRQSLGQGNTVGGEVGEGQVNFKEEQGVQSTSVEEDVEMVDLEKEIEVERQSPEGGNVNLENEERKEPDVGDNSKEKEQVRVKVERISSSEQPKKESSCSSRSGSPSDTAVTTPSKSQEVSYIHCSQCDTKTKDRAYLKRHFRAHHCQVGCGDYDLICTACVKALKRIVAFPRGLEGYDYNQRFNPSKEELKCPDCSTVSQKHRAHYIRSHYRERHCKIGCAKYDQICTGCVAVLEKLTVWPKPLVGHDYSTGPPPVGFQCPKCKKGIERKYFKRHYRHLHCKVHCIEKEKGVCKKCFLVFKRMNMLSKCDGPGIDYKVK